MIPIRKPLTIENIFSIITSYDIFRFYSKNFKEINKLFKSDLRKENNPSCCIGVIGDDLLYTDFGLGKSYRAINFVMELYKISYPEALQRINVDFNLGLGSDIKVPILTDKVTKNPAIYGKKEFHSKNASIIKKRKRDYTKRDLEYWNSYFWTKEMLVEAKTESISHYWINGVMWKVGNDELAFSYEYYFHSGRLQRKLYFPERKEYKWVSNTDSTIVQLVDVMPKVGDILFITSSKKDAGIFWRMQRDRMFPDLTIHGVAPNSELSFVPEQWFSKIKKRYKKIIIWYDNDVTGIRSAERYSGIYGIPFFYNPIGSPKDPSDFCKENGIYEFYKLVKSYLDE